MKNGVGRTLALLILPRLAVVLLRLWFATCRIRVHHRERLTAWENSGRPLIATCWHYCVLGFFSLFRLPSTVVMISASNDGDFLAGAIERAGYAVVRGSSNRKGARAAKELIRMLRGGKNGGLVADGSQGPPRIAQNGAIYLAARSGGVVLPMLYSASRYHAFGTWDRLILPQPFSTIDLFYGEPLPVPEDVDAAGMEIFRSRLETSLNDLYAEAWSVHGRSGH